MLADGNSGVPQYNAQGDLEPVGYRETQAPRPLPYYEKKMNRIALKVALLMISVSALANQSGKDTSRHDGTNVGPPHQSGLNDITADKGKRGNVDSNAGKQGVPSNPSSTPAQGNRVQPASGNYNRDLLR